MHKQSLIRDFTSGGVAKQMVAFSLPLFFSNLLQAVYNMVDMVVIGQYVGRVGLSAVSVGGDVLNLLSFLAMGFAAPVRCSSPSSSAQAVGRTWAA